MTDPIFSLTVNELIQRAIDKIGGDAPKTLIEWSSYRHPPGRVHFLNLVPDSFSEILSRHGTGIILGWSINVWINECGITFKQRWVFDYFAHRDDTSQRMKVIRQIAGHDEPKHKIHHS